MSITLNAKRKRRLMMVGLLVVGVGIAAALALFHGFGFRILYGEFQVESEISHQPDKCDQCRDKHRSHD